jgi:transposase-like protein
MTKKTGLMSKPLRRDFSAEFKAEAVSLVSAGKKPVTQLARELEVPRQLLHSWVRQSKKSAGKPTAQIFPGHGNVQLMKPKSIASAANSPRPKKTSRS